MTPNPPPLALDDQHIGNQSIYKKHDPLQVLPPEVVGKIFQQWLLDELHGPLQLIHSQLPAVLCSVSKAWRDFVYGFPLLWRHVVIKATKDSVPNLRALENRMIRSQHVPLIIDISVGERPDYAALRVIFSHCHRFHDLTLRISDLSWWSKVTMAPFSLLACFAVYTPALPGLLVKQEELNAIFTSAPRLRHVNWHSFTDPGPLCTKGHQLRSLEILAFRVSVARVLDVMAACPNLRDVSIDANTESHIVPAPLREPITMGALKTLHLAGSKHLQCILDSIRTPQLISFSIRLARHENSECAIKALESFLAHCPMLEYLALEEVIRDEEVLIRILDSHPGIKRLSVIASPTQHQLVTDKLFKLLAFRHERGQIKTLLPLLEELKLSGGISIRDSVVMEMVQSRSSDPVGTDAAVNESQSRIQSPPITNALSTTLRSIHLDRCKPMSAELVPKLLQICQRGQVQVTGAYITPSLNFWVEPRH